MTIEKHQFIPPPLVRLKPTEWHLKRGIGECVPNLKRSRCQWCGLLRGNPIHQIDARGAVVPAPHTPKAQDPDNMVPTWTGRRRGPLFKPKT
jgi:hypothetical protein